MYAILARETPLPPGLRGFGGAVVSTLPWRALAAASSPLASGTVRPRAEDVVRHEAIVRELDRALSGHALERRCTLLPTPRLAERAAYLLDPRRVLAVQDTRAKIRRAHSDLRFPLSER